MQDYHQLIGWQKAHAFAVGVHALTESWSKRDTAGLMGQLRRAAQSIPANLAEGCGRESDRDFAKFVQQAIGSTTEAQYHLEFARDTGMIESTEFSLHQERVVEVRKILVGLVKRLRGK
jgi:four helix bundle protein